MSKINRKEEENSKAQKGDTFPNPDIQRKIDLEQAEALTSRAAGDTTVSSVGE